MDYNQPSLPSALNCSSSFFKPSKTSAHLLHSFSPSWNPPARGRRPPCPSVSWSRSLAIKESAYLVVSHSPHPSNRLLHANYTPCGNKLLALANTELQLTHAIDIFLARAPGRSLVECREEPDHKSWETPSQTVDGCDATDGKYWKQVLAKTCEYIEVVVVNARRGCNQRLIINDSMRKLAANNVGVSRQLLEC